MKALLFHGFGWVLAFVFSALMAAWLCGWQVACGLSLMMACTVVLWQAWHIKTLLRALHHSQNVSALAMLEPNRLTVTQLALQANLQHALPNGFGIWGEVFYLLRRLIKAHQQELATLKTQQDRLVQAVHASPNAFILLDKLGCVAWMNAAAQRLLGLDAQRDTGQKLAFLLRTPAIAAMLDSSRTHKSITVEINHSLIEVQSLPFGDQQTLLLGQDFTQLARTEQVRRDFVANVSHELRTPLTVLTGYTELLLDHVTTLPPALQDAVSHMAHHTQRMNALTQDLLQLAVLDASGTGDALLSQETVNVNLWLKQVEQSTEALSHTERGSIHLVFEPCDAAFNVVGTLKELHSALSNLVGNALRYTPAGGTVTVAAKQHTVLSDDGIEIQQVHIAVNDTGCGIEAVHLPRLTERFYRVSSSRHRGLHEDTAGTGLGLAIAKHVMLRHGGELRITSTVGKGSCFMLVLPVL
jgi:two-component system, OmpR family, phosphate regulon sensor histidine kinase PhoR